MNKISPAFVPHRLTQWQRNNRLSTTQDHLQTISSDRTVLTKIVAADETWCYAYDPRSKQSDMQWLTKDEPCPAKPLRSRSTKKMLLILYFDAAGVILADFIEGTIDSETYVESLRRMREAMRQKCPLIWQTWDYWLLHDNASPHTSDDTVNFLESVEQKVWDHLAYSPDLSPCDFWAFPRMKHNLKGHRFQSLKDLETAVRRELRNIPTAEFTKCFNNLAHQYELCVNAQGGYFEGKGSCPGLNTED